LYYIYSTAAISDNGDCVQPEQVIMGASLCSSKKDKEIAKANAEEKISKNEILTHIAATVINYVEIDRRNPVAELKSMKNGETAIIEIEIDSSFPKRFETYIAFPFINKMLECHGQATLSILQSFKTCLCDNDSKFFFYGNDISGRSTKFWKLIKFSNCEEYDMFFIANHVVVKHENGEIVSAYSKWTNVPIYFALNPKKMVEKVFIGCKNLSKNYFTSPTALPWISSQKINLILPADLPLPLDMPVDIKTKTEEVDNDRERSASEDYDSDKTDFINGIREVNLSNGYNSPPLSCHVKPLNIPAVIGEFTASRYQGNQLTEECQTFDFNISVSDDILFEIHKTCNLLLEVARN